MNRNTDPFLPYGHHVIEDDDVAAVVAALENARLGGMLTGGDAVVAFESGLVRVTGSRHAVACASGTAALHLAALALGLGPGDMVAVPAITFLATANAARYVGADVVFTDVDPATGLMRACDLEKAIAIAGSRLKAVFPVHLAGQVADMSAIHDLARSHGLRIVEDACHALGAFSGNDAVGSCRHSDMAVFSFHPVKTVSTGEGGAVATNDDALAAFLARARSHGMVRDHGPFENPELAFGQDMEVNPWYYEMSEIGFNYRISDINCALGVSQLAKLDRFVAGRRELVADYDRLIAPLAPLVRPLGRVAGCSPAWHLYVVLIDFAAADIDRATLMHRLHDQGIGSQVHYIPVNRQPYYRKLYGDISLPGAEAYYARALSLPLFPAMTGDDVARVVGALSSLVGGVP